MDHDFRAGLLSSVLAAGLILAITFVALADTAAGWRVHAERGDIARVERAS